MPHRFDQALKLHQQGHVGQAAALYEAILRDQPDHAGAAHFLGIVHHSRGQNDRALEIIEQALAHCSTKPVYWSNYGAVLRDMNRIQEAKAAFERALALRPDYADACSNLGLALRDLGDRLAAFDCFQQAVRLKPNHVDAMFHLADLSAEFGNTQAAIGWYERLLEVAPDHFRGLRNLGQLYLDRISHIHQPRCWRWLIGRVDPISDCQMLALRVSGKIH